MKNTHLQHPEDVILTGNLDIPELRAEKFDFDAYINADYDY
jgi:hypothetical protein